MHQLPRPSSKAAPRPAPSRPNDRAAAESGDRNRASQPRMSADAPGRAGGEALVGPSRSLAGHSKEAMAKMNQIVQVKGLVPRHCPLDAGFVGARARARECTLADAVSYSLQNYFIKAALIIVHSRMTCPPSYNKGTGVKRVNKWVSLPEKTQTPLAPFARCLVSALVAAVEPLADLARAPSSMSRLTRPTSSGKTGGPGRRATPRPTGRRR